MVGMGECVCGYSGTDEGLFRHLSMGHDNGDEWKKVKLVADMMGIHTAVGGDRVTQAQYESLGRWSKGAAMRAFDFDSFHEFQNISLQSVPRKIEYICSACGEKFKKHTSVDVGEKTYCSNECTKNRQEHICHNCGEKFERPQSYYEHRSGKKKFCSSECASFKIKESTCKLCEEHFEYKPYNRSGVFCGQKCYDKWRDKNGEKIMGGEKNPMWAGGNAGYYGQNWAKQRRRALERDNYICQRCGMKNEEHKDKFGQELHVHHKTKYRKFDSNEDAHVLDNLITLCVGCHNKVEQQS